jgi:hypothetical protein
VRPGLPFLVTAKIGENAMQDSHKHKTDAACKGTWRDVLPVHPAAELFPLMSETELCELSEDIKKNGLREKVDIYKGCVLDGRNRLDALELIGRTWDDILVKVGECPTHDGPNFDPYAYVVTKNLYRRHLTVDQKKKIVAKLLKAKPETPNLQIAKQVKVDDKTVAKVRTDLERRSEIPNVKTKTDSKGREQPAHKPKRSVEEDIEWAKIAMDLHTSAAPKPRHKAEQKTFDSPQEAHTSAKAIGLGALAISWHEVEAQASAGNKPRLLTALSSHLEQVRRALKDWGEGVQ